jgi:hypothetical protein
LTGFESAESVDGLAGVKSVYHEVAARTIAIGRRREPVADGVMHGW